MSSAIDRLFSFGTWVPEVWRNTIQRKEHEQDFSDALDEVRSLRKVLVFADRLLTVCETDGSFSAEDQVRMRNEIDKAMSFVLVENSRRTQHALDAALWVCQNCGEASEISSQRCSVCNTPRQ